MQVKCPSCHFLNFSISAYCGRCDRPLPTANLSEKTIVSHPEPLFIDETPTAQTTQHQQKTIVQKISARPSSLRDMETHIGGELLTIAPTWRLLVAMLIDSLLIIAVGFLTTLLEMAVFDIEWTQGNVSMIDAFATWVSLYPSTCLRALSSSLLFAWLYTCYGSYTGRTLGRRLMRLMLIGLGHNHIYLAQAALRASLSLLDIMLFGAGYFWMIVDNRKRSWHDVVCRDVVIYQHH